ncbi:hypothetical protein FHL15_000275 [Xylaria flabelliformis]|uniref:Uncharacterized protein n=1 Tax=Xylaria flabelliformis TaxID=2512241 RepID=A0A553IFF6_9PEZI|nr:hypothetical protein FHL15_000275 [Xylaria flabelliformis]
MSTGIYRQGQPRATQEISSRKIVPQSRTIPYAQDVTSHPTTLDLNSSRLEHSRGEFDIGLASDRTYSQGTSSLRQEASGHEFSRPISPPTGPPTMSAVAVSFDPRMEMGVPRSTYGWHSMPGLESSPELLSHEVSSVGHGSDISSLTPPSGSRSLTSSSPRPILTPEQRELKRQRDQARRDSKTSARVRRGMSNNSYPPAAAQSPPVTIHDFSSAPAMPIYTTAPSQISLLAEPVTTVGPSYMSSYSTSPLPDHGNSQMFPHYSPLPSNDYMGMSYSAGYPPPPSTQSLSSQYSSRASSMSESGIMYSVPPVLPSGNPPTADAGHQPLKTSTREIWASGQGELPQLRRRIYKDNGTQRSFTTRQV